MKRTAYKLLLSVFITFAQVIAPSLTGREGGESLYAQDENTAFYIYQNDGHFDGFFYDEVQKISYSFLDTLGIEHPEVVSQEIVTADSTYRIMLSAIDSIGFVQPEIKYNPKLKIVDEMPYSINWYESENMIWIYVRKEYNVSEELLPHVGDVYASFDTKNGWAAKVVKVTQDPNIDSYLIKYDLECEPISDITDIFQQFVTVEEYGYDDAGNLARRRVAGRPDLTVGKSPKKAQGQWEGDIFNFSLSGHIPLYDKNDMTININPTIEGKLHLKTVWNLSWFGDKYISILTKLNMGVGATFTVDGKIKDFFPGGIGGLVGGVPIPATCPIIMLDITPDAFLRGEAHVTFSLSSPKLQGAIWSKLEIKNWEPFFDIGKGNSDDGSQYEYVDNSNPKAKISLTGFVQAGMLFPMKFKSLPVIKKLAEMEIGGNWFVGPKLAADFTLDMTNMPWYSTAAYTQLKNITAQVHLLDADYEVKGTVKTAFSGTKEVTLADGSINLFPPFDASFVPEFEDVADYDSTMLVGDKLRDCRVISFKPSGYVIKPVDVGVALFNVKEDNTIDYNESRELGDFNKYYHIAQILGQDLDKSQWPKIKLPYPLGKSAGILSSNSGKIRAVPYAFVLGRYCFAPKSYDLELKPWYTVSSKVWELEYDGTIKTPLVFSGYIDNIIHKLGMVVLDHYGPPYFLDFIKTPEGNEKNSFTATVIPDQLTKNYHPIDTLFYEVEDLRPLKQVDGSTWELGQENIQVQMLPCPNDPILTGLSIDACEHLPSLLEALCYLNVKPTVTIERFEKAADRVGWHVVMSYQKENAKANASFDIVCTSGSQSFVISNGQFSYSDSHTYDDSHGHYEYASCSMNSPFDGRISIETISDYDGTCNFHFFIQGNGHYETDKMNESYTPIFDITLSFAFE